MSDSAGVSQIPGRFEGVPACVFNGLSDFGVRFLGMWRLRLGAAGSGCRVRAGFCRVFPGFGRVKLGFRRVFLGLFGRSGGGVVLWNQRVAG